MKPKKPTIAVIDGDLALFPAACSAEQVWYSYFDEDDNLIAKFPSAAEGKAWLEEIDFIGCDIQFGFKGDPEKLVRKTSIEVGDFKTAKKNYRSLIRRWLNKAGVDNYIIYLAKKSGAPNFRHEAALRKVYKGNRKGDKPHYLEPLRKWALTLKNHKKAVGGFETDDVVCYVAQARGEKAVLIQNEKDCMQVRGCWVLYPDEHDEPVFSDPTTLGYIEQNKKGKIIGLGHLALLSQVITGDKADNYDGIKGAGPKKAVDTLSPFNNLPEDRLEEPVRAVADLYREVYGDAYPYKNRLGESVTGSWKDFMIESVRLAYMVKGRGDYPHMYVDLIEKIWSEYESDS